MAQHHNCKALSELEDARKNAIENVGVQEIIQNHVAINLQSETLKKIDSQNDMMLRTELELFYLSLKQNAKDYVIKMIFQKKIKKHFKEILRLDVIKQLHFEE